MTPRASLTVELRGGLANQLFQWATFQTIWDQTRGPLLWDERYICRPGMRGNELRRISLVPTADIINQSHADRLRWRLFAPMPNRVREYATCTFKVHAPRHTQQVLREEQLREAHRFDSHWWARGYFQDPRVFAPAREEIREALRLALERVVPTKIWCIDHPYSAIHVRRGDYVTVEKITDRLGVCTLDYFCAAAGDLDAALPIKVVSDDPDWCRSALSKAVARDVEVIETGSDIADLLILMGSTEIILSNSTFSWWGAFAGEARRVIAPSRFFDADDAGGDRLPDIADTLREKTTGRLTVAVD